MNIRLILMEILPFYVRLVVLAWLAVAAMAVNITSGLTGKYLVQRAW